MRFWRTQQVPESAMTLWVSTQEPPEGMTIDDRVKLADHDGGTVSVVNRDATSAEVIQLITEGGAVVSELALTLEDVASFVLANGTLKRLAYLDIQGEAKGDPLSQEEEANADLILSGDAVRKVYQNNAPSFAAVIGDSSNGVPALLSRPNSSPVIQLLASFASRPLASASK